MSAGFARFPFGFSAQGLVFRVLFFVFRISKFGFRVSCFMCRFLFFLFLVSCFVFHVSCFVFRVSCFVFLVFCLRCGVQGIGLKVYVLASCARFGLVQVPPSSEYGTYETVKARFWPWVSNRSPKRFELFFPRSPPQNISVNFLQTQPASRCIQLPYIRCRARREHV